MRIWACVGPLVTYLFKEGGGRQTLLSSRSLPLRSQASAESIALRLAAGANQSPREGF